MEVAAGALIVPRRIRVTLSGTDYTIPALTAAEWMVVLLERGWEDIVPGLVDGDLDALWDRVWAGEVAAEECEAAAQDAVTAAAGVDWWAAVKLVHSAAQDPGVMGELRTSGADLDRMPLGALLAALYRIYTRDKDKKDIAKINAELARPPEGMSSGQARYDETAAAAAFEARYARQRNR